MMPVDVRMHVYTYIFVSDANSCHFLNFAQEMVSFKDSKNSINFQSKNIGCNLLVLTAVLIKPQWLLQAKTDGQVIPMSCVHVQHTARIDLQWDAERHTEKWWSQNQASRTKLLRMIMVINWLTCSFFFMDFMSEKYCSHKLCWREKKSI